MEFENYGELISFEIACWRQELIDPKYPVDELGTLSLELASKLRALGIMALLAKADSDLFYHNLIRGGIAREIYLQRLKNEGIDKDHHRASGRYASLLNAVAAGDMALARRIVDLSPAEWQKGHEYKDDYCYAQILHRLVQEAPPEQEIIPLLNQFETYLEGEPSARLNVCKALMERDQNTFDEAFDALLKEQEAKIAADKARCQMEDPIVMAQRLVFVEGLAILRLAEGRELATQFEYQYCPSLARIPMNIPFPGE